MARPQREPATPSALAPALLRYVEARGHDARLLALRVGLEPEDAGREEVAVTTTTLTVLLEAAAEVLGEPFLGLYLPADLPLRRYGPAELAARASATVHEALERMIRYGPLIHPELELALELDSEERAAVVRQSTPRKPRGIGRHTHEYGLAYVLTQLRIGIDERIAPRSVWFAHARPPDLAPLHGFFGTTELSFGENSSGFALARETLDRPVRSRDPRLLSTADGLAQSALAAVVGRRGSLASALTARLETLLPDRADIDGAARLVHMSPRTLQRRLDDEGTRFSEVLDTTRKDLAVRWLGDTGLSLTEIAYRLGFADLATFSRAFKRWTGKPPGMWRRP